MDWDKAYKNLLEYIARYAEIGRDGLMGLNIGLLPLYKRYQRGERTQELYDEMMEVQ